MKQKETRLQPSNGRLNLDGAEERFLKRHSSCAQTGPSSQEEAREKMIAKRQNPEPEQMDDEAAASFVTPEDAYEQFMAEPGPSKSLEARERMIKRREGKAEDDSRDRANSRGRRDPAPIREESLRKDCLRDVYEAFGQQLQPKRQLKGNADSARQKMIDQRKKGR